MKIVLTTLHAKYIHASLALPYLAAATSGIPGCETVIREFTVNETRMDVLRGLLEERADVVAFSCYIWNVEAVCRIASDLRKLRPEILLAAGGPEVSHTSEEFLRENRMFDCVIRGEGEKTWAEFLGIIGRVDVARVSCHELPAGVTCRSGSGIVTSPDREPVENLDEIPSPFELGLVDLNKALVYYETSRGCPFRCAFCLSSLEKGVRSFSWDRIRQDLLHLMDRGVALVKLVDRTFNFDPERADDIWNFILERNRTSRFHFEIAADLLTESNYLTLRKAPPGMFRFEIGVQAADRGTLARVGRHSDTDRVLANVKRLKDETGVTVHLDLIAGLPGEDFPGFLGSLQRLFPVRPHHIQVEPLKVLKGSPMQEIAARDRYAYSDTPPYAILRTPCLSFDDIRRIEGLARLLDLFYNSGRFCAALACIGKTVPLSVFFDSLERHVADGNVSLPLPLKGLFTLLWTFSGKLLGEGLREDLRDALCYDYCMTEYPSTGMHTEFLTQDEIAAKTAIPRESLNAMLNSIPVPQGSRVRTFARHFMRNYTTAPPADGPVCLVFVYLSIPGEGLRVIVRPSPVKTEL
jgi:anaerobic magnesium-protoporphyrin IX monomethyl ester cyclase